MNWPKAQDLKALVTGASRGIGKAIADAFLEAGYRVLTPSREELELSSVESVRAYIASSNHTDIDILVNNAGENPIREIELLPYETFERVLRVNLGAPFLMIQAVLPHMRQRRWGRIVNISSCYSKVSRPGRSDYSASKSGLNSLTRTAALEGARDNILVNAVCPGFAETSLTHQNNTPEQLRALCGQIPLGRLVSPGEIAKFVLFLAGSDNTYITGQTINIDGGFLCQ